MYAGSEERVDGGGSLDLVKMVTEELGLEDGCITGTWDSAHQLQVIVITVREGYQKSATQVWIFNSHPKVQVISWFQNISLFKIWNFQPKLSNLLWLEYMFVIKMHGHVTSIKMHYHKISPYFLGEVQEVWTVNIFFNTLDNAQFVIYSTLTIPL